MALVALETFHPIYEVPLATHPKKSWSACILPFFLPADAFEEAGAAATSKWKKDHRGEIFLPPLALNVSWTDSLEHVLDSLGS